MVAPAAADWASPIRVLASRSCTAPVIGSRWPTLRIPAARWRWSTFLTPIMRAIIV